MGETEKTTKNERWYILTSLTNFAMSSSPKPKPTIPSAGLNGFGNCCQPSKTYMETIC